MSIGTFGNIRPSDVNVDDINVYYSYVPSRDVVNNTFIKLNSSDVLTQIAQPDSEAINGYNDNLLEGLYDLKLPASVFGDLGIYTIYLKPKMFSTVIRDCGVLSALPTIKGIVIDTTDLTDNMVKSNGLQGYRIEYVDNDGLKIRNLSRFVVTSNKVSVVTENIGNTTQKALRYRYDDSGTKLFLQLTPNSSSDVKPNQSPFIGNVDEIILISNTFFTPITIEVEMVQNTIDSVAQILIGNEIRDVRKGIVTHYDANNKITNQSDVYEIKESIDDTKPLYEVREERKNIDASQDFDTITNI